MGVDTGKGFVSQKARVHHTMRQFTTRMGSRAPGIRVRGYRIKVTYLGQAPIVTKTIWSADTPCEWDAVKRDAQVISAVLIRSGRTFATYQREQVQS